MPTILLTGANRGLGHSLLKSLVETDKELTFYLGCRSEEKFKATVDSLKNLPGFDKKEFYFVEINLMKSETVESAVSLFMEKKVRFDILIHNAAVLFRETFDQISQVTLNINFLKTKRLNDLIMCNSLLKEGFKVIFLSAILGNIGILKDKKMADEIRKAKADDLELMANNFIYQADELSKTTEMIEKDRALFPEYAYSKLLINVYTGLLKENELVKKLNGFVVALHPGVLKTDMGTDHAPLEVEEGVVPIIKLIDIDNKSKEADEYNGQLVTRNLQKLDIYDKNIDFLKFAI